MSPYLFNEYKQAFKIRLPMACQACREMEGHWTSKEAEFDQLFHILTSINSGLVSIGTAECKKCRQTIEFEFDDTLIPKLKIGFIQDK